jgi:LysM repeat protein
MLKMKINSSVMNYNPKSAIKAVALTCALSSILFSSFSKEIAKDSVGLKKEGGKSYVLYKVEPKQTLFSIVKRYGSSVAEFKAANPGLSESVNVGQTIKIPYNGKVVSSAPVVSKPTPVAVPSTPTVPTETVKMVSHVVESGQGLYAVATKYKVTMADLRKWNNLTTDQLAAGQVLIVDAREYERAKKAGELPAKGEVVKVEDTNMGNQSTTTTQKPSATEPVDVSDTKTSSETSKTSSGYRKTIETGLAELIDVEDKSGKYLGLHRSAPVGTLVNVKNSSNGQSIWVKIVGKLPDIGSDKVIIKLSPRAFEKLNPSDKRIRAEISYMTP